MAEVDENHSFQQQLNNLQRELEEKFSEQKRVSDEKLEEKFSELQRVSDVKLEELKELQRVSDAKFSDQQREIDALKEVVRDDGEWSPPLQTFPLISD